MIGYSAASTTQRKPRVPARSLLGAAGLGGLAGVDGCCPHPCVALSMTTKLNPKKWACLENVDTKSGGFDV